ncbi:MAG: putative ABC transporter permease, type IV [Treponematales bacterium]
METVNGQLIVFQFFLLSFAGWVLESIQESLVRRTLVNKGFFRGPYVPVQGLGGLCVYAVCVHFKTQPLLVFLLGTGICTAAEYLTALFLEKCFRVQCWDYRTYPHTRWCHFQGRVCLTISLFFGLITLFVVYAFWDWGLVLFRALKSWASFAAGLFTGAFLFDAAARCAEVLWYKQEGIRLSGHAVFSLEDRKQTDEKPRAL